MSRRTAARTRFSSSASVKNAPCEQQPSSARPAMMPWQPLPKTHVQRDSSQVRSARIRCSASAGSGNSIHSRGKSRSTSRLRGSAGRPRASLDLRRHPAQRTPVTRSRRALPVKPCGWACSTSAPTPCICWWSTPTAGAHPWPAHSEKAVLRLAERSAPDGALTAAGRDGAGRGGGAGARRGRAAGRRTTCSPSPPPRCATPPTRPQVLAPGSRRDRRPPAGALRRGRGADDLPRGAPLVRLVGRAAAGARHRRRLAGDRGRHRRGARTCALSLPLGRRAG